MAKEAAYEVRSNTFANLTTVSNGGVINFTTNVKLIVSSCVFIGNKATGSNSYGGSIYISSTKDYSISKACAYECVGYEGHFLYSTSSSSPLATINETMTTLCSGEWRGVIMITKHNLLTRMYNTSFCTSNRHCNIHSFSSLFNNDKFLQFYKNNEDIVYGANAPGSNHTGSFINLISNGHSENQYGYIHSNVDGMTLTVDNVFAYGNERNTIFNPCSGTIVVKSFKGNACEFTGAVSFSGSLTIDASFVWTTKMIEKLYCMYSLNESKCSVRQCAKTMISYLNYIIMCQY